MTAAYPQSNIELQAVRVSSPPRIDGLVDDSEWRDAAVVTEFYQRLPHTGSPVSERTEFFVCYDTDNLYVGAHCYGDPSDITAIKISRDAVLRFDDAIQLMLDTFLDRRNAYWFEINPRGSIGDAIISQNGASHNLEWDGLWIGKAQIHEQGWDAEIAIPFKTLSFRPDQTVWGIKLRRSIIKKNETAYWPVANLDTYTFQISDAAQLVGLTGLNQGYGLDLSPYLLTGGDYHRQDSEESVLDVGLDAFYQITPGLKSAVSLNTDFAQTEADARQLNLTRFALFFPEKRDFFLDGANYFQFGVEETRGGGNPAANRLVTFFSRRIGIDEDGNPIPMFGGAKMTGQQGAWNLGLLSAVDDRDDRNEAFMVGRVARNFGSQSYIGGIATYGNANSEADNSVLGLDLRLATSGFLQNRNLIFTLFGLKSTTSGIDDADLAFGAETSYPNDFLNIRAGFNQIEANFHPGVGFVPRKDIRTYYLSTNIGPRPNKWGILQVVTGGTMDYFTNLSGRLLTRTIEVSPFTVEMLSGDLFGFSIVSEHEVLPEIFEIRDGNEILPGEFGFTRFLAGATTAERRDLWAGVEYGWGDFWNGKREDLTLRSGWKVNVPVFLGLEYEHSDVSLPDGDFVTNVLRLNIDILFNPDVTFQNFIQYDDESDTIGWQSRFRWIVRPGNEVLLVANSLFKEQTERIRLADASSRFKLKYNYRF